ncbi:MAG: histidine kinase, partial [Bacteroidia bacterium]|nr:histidine kinase [Bacteroidia bacterium]
MKKFTSHIGRSLFHRILLLTIGLVGMNAAVQAQKTTVTEPLTRYCKNLPAEIHSVCRDNYGLVWLATSFGIYKYSGNEVTIDAHFNKGEFSHITELKPNVFGILGGNKFYIYQPYSNKVFGYDLPTVNNRANWISAVELGNNDSIFLTYKGQCLVFNLKADGIKLAYQMTNVEGNYLFRYFKGESWLYSIDKNENTTPIFKMRSDAKFANADVYSYYHADVNQIVDSFTLHQLEHMPLNTPIDLNLLGANNIPRAIKKNFFGTLKWNDSSDILVNPARYKIKYILKDNQGFIWIVGSSGVFINYPKKSNFQNKFPHYSARGIMAISGNKRIVSMENNFAIVDDKFKIIQSFPFKIYGIMRYNADSILLTSDAQQCAWFNERTYQLSKITKTEERVFLYHGSIKSTPGKVLVYGSGIRELDVKKGVLRNCLLSENSNIGLFRCGIQMDKDIFYFGGNTGLYEYNLKLNSIKKLRSDFVLHMVKMNENQFAVGLLGGGALVLNAKAEDTKVIQGWPFDGNSKNAYTLLYYKGDLWAGTGNGLVRYNLETKKYKIFYTESGTGNTEYNTPSSTVINDTTLWFGGLNGISVVNTNSSKFNTGNQKLFVTGFKYFNTRWIRLEQQENTKEGLVYNVPAGVSDIEFQLGIEDFVHVSNYEVQYRINNLDKSWYSIGAFQPIRISNLNYGEYVLELRIHDLQTGESGAVMYKRIVIHAFWYQTIWAKMIFGLLFFTVLFLVLRWNNNRVKRSLESQNSLLKAEMKALSAQIDPHFLANLMSSAQLRIIKGSQNEALDILSEYGQLMRKKFETNQHEFTNIEEEVSMLENYISVAGVLAGANFKHRIQLKLNRPSKEFIIPAGFIQPIVENVFKHAWVGMPDVDKRLDIAFEAEKSEVVVTITDNGRGMKLEQTPLLKSSLNNIEKRMALMSK